MTPPHPVTEPNLKISECSTCGAAPDGILLKRGKPGEEFLDEARLEEPAAHNPRTGDAIDVPVSAAEFAAKAKDGCAA